MSPPARVFRFAPSPNGFLHLGHGFSALLNSDLARQCGGRFLLRIEDIDIFRARPEFEQAIYEDLAWLGLRWEQPARKQSEHFGDYFRALEKLEALGLLYPCACARGEIARAAGKDGPCDPDGAPLYPGTCRDKPRRPIREVLSEGGVALRLDMAKALATIQPSLRAEGEAIQESRAAPGLLRHSVPRNDGGKARLAWREHGIGEVVAHPEHWGDVVLARKDSRPAIISPWSSTTRCRASPMSCAARICFTRRACIGCCSACSAFPRRITAIMRFCWTRTAKNFPKAACRNRCARCAPRA